MGSGPENSHVAQGFVSIELAMQGEAGRISDDPQPQESRAVDMQPDEVHKYTTLSQWGTGKNVALIRSFWALREEHDWLPL